VEGELEISSGMNIFNLGMVSFQEKAEKNGEIRLSRDTG
jgi:hypothetical protein